MQKQWCTSSRIFGATRRRNDRQTVTPEAAQRHRVLGLLALAGAIVAFSLGSTLVKKAETPGITVAFWRMTVCTVGWAVIMRLVDRRWLTRFDVRDALLPGFLFGINITAFFTGVTHTSVAHAEFIGSMSPFLLVPAGAWLFNEKINPRALLFGLISIFGLFLVLAYGPANGEATLKGDLFIVCAMFMWAGYLLSARKFRQGRTVSTVMAAMMPVATVTVGALAVVTGSINQLGQVTSRSVVFILLLAVLTGTGAHGCIVYAQRSVPVGTISIMQVAQPALAVVWSVLLLGNHVRPIQLVGMALVIFGLIAVTVMSRREVT